MACVTASMSGQLAWLVTGKVVFLLPMIAVLRWTALVQHNHSHVTLFRNASANRLLALALGTVTGMPMELYREAHTRTHHRHTGTSKDWTQPTELLDGEAVQARPLSRRRNLCVFAARGWVMGTTAVRQDRAATKRLRGECGAMAVIVALPVLLGSPSRLLAVALLWVVVAVVSADANFKHHDGYLVADEPTEFANDSFSLLHTTLGFNIGYHSAHHKRPSAHWSRLPGLAKEASTAGHRRAELREGA